MKPGAEPARRVRAAVTHEFGGPMTIESEEGTAWINPGAGTKAGVVAAPLLGLGLGTAIGVAALPLGAAVEMDVVVG